MNASAERARAMMQRAQEHAGPMSKRVGLRLRQVSERALTKGAHWLKTGHAWLRPRAVELLSTLQKQTRKWVVRGQNADAETVAPPAALPPPDERLASTLAAGASADATFVTETPMFDDADTGQPASAGSDATIAVEAHEDSSDEAVQDPRRDET